MNIWKKWFAWHPVKTEKGWRWLVFVYKDRTKGRWEYSSIPTVDIELTTSKVTAKSRKLKTKWKLEISPWVNWVNMINEPEHGWIPGDFKINEDTQEAYGVQPENPQDPEDDWRWIGWHRNPDGEVISMRYADAYNKIYSEYWALNED